MQTWFDRSLQGATRALTRVKGGTRVARALCGLAHSQLGRPLIARAEGGFLLQVDPRRELPWNVFAYGFFERGLHQFLRDNLRPDAVYLDIGANVGCHALAAAARVGKSGRVLAFEPDPAVFATLDRNLALNQFPQMQTLHCALGARAGEIQFYRAPSGPFDEALGSVHPSSWHQGGGTVTVRMDRLDDLAPRLGLTRLDLVKIDVEGAEREVIEGARQTLAAWRPTLVMEINPHTAAAAGWQPGELLATLRSFGYDLHSLDHEGRLQPVPGVEKDFTLVARPAASNGWIK